VLFGLSLCLLGGAALQQLLAGLPVPYTMLLLVFGVCLGAWTVFDPAYTLQPGTLAGSYSWGGHLLECNVTVRVDCAHDHANNGEFLQFSFQKRL